jgi:hypothetical protein
MAHEQPISNEYVQLAFFVLDMHLIHLKLLMRVSSITDSKLAVEALRGAHVLLLCFNEIRIVALRRLFWFTSPRC